ncbi:54S ribosomal protein L41, mitochondrial [Nakaseomyces glabratus]|uniref:Large ribosomal subunit protein uL23m n=1 Tax=Candida glabrata TaxID=5478 RepID=A0A0W0DGL0_CANGB|nr:Ribosomal protein L23 [Nakaseomyces glabratus]KAH7604063.1 Ribosomal protein L23 [Nakaseomyces glabratus]KAH7614056.1 Ribosomal protein L23 [Nakaseomyces glabratus]KTA97020.1 54S ribosomal protein L41, mitochondrial [Nakaseomyces glabratus]KTB06972.1 54S ribosomal protein L41, mitochondrial [Nakaseomyces glabratus]
MPRLVGKSVSDHILGLAQKGIEENAAHFKVGGKKLYFPKARVILLRPNAKHTPYQAKFIVPKSFNKLDLRDYLFHVYGLRAMNVTTQLLHGRYERAGNIASPRYRGPQIKKMTIDMNEPFIWPEEDTENSLWDHKFAQELNKYREETMMKLGSDKLKPHKAFDGALGPFNDNMIAQPFIPKQLKRRMLNQKQQDPDYLKINQFL